MIAVIDYGMGNITSVKNAFNYLGYESELANTKIDIEHADKLVLPGVGSYKKAMENINKLGFYDLIKDKVENQKCPVLGICLGMQIMGKDSEEDGYTKGFGFLDYSLKEFVKTSHITVPHIGFNEVKIMNKESAMFKGINDLSDFYFVHSYRIENQYDPYISGVTKYGEEFISAFEKGHIWGVQFHPEKSQSNGLKLLDNFAKR